MAGRDIIVIGTSAGGVEALKSLVGTLPAELPAALFVVLHIPAGEPSLLPDILHRHGPLAVLHPRDGEPVEHGRIYVAPPDFHMLLRPGCVELSRGPRENHVRPAIDPLFRSAARAYGPRVIGVVLTGHLYDGTAGLMAVRQAGGVAVVQDPADALVDVMPRNARDLAGADHVVPLDRLGETLVNLVREPPGEGRGPTVAEKDGREQQIINETFAQHQMGNRNEQVAVVICPECGGPLWQFNEGQLVQFRCHVGHSYYPEGLLEQQSEMLEAALWTAVRIFREKAVTARQLVIQARAKGDPLAERYEDQAHLSEQYGELIEQSILRGAAGASHSPADPVRPPVPLPLEEGAGGSAESPPGGQDA